jgi:predicted transcriptional regulator
MDTIRIELKSKDTLVILTSKNNNCEKTVLVDKKDLKTNTEKSSDNILLPIKDLVIGIIWPITTLIIVFVIRKHLKGLFVTIGTLLSRTKKITKDGIEFDNSGLIPSESKPESSSEIKTDNVMPKPDDNAMVKKILKTLWTYQLQYSKDYNVRWTFTLGIVNADYDEFIKSIKLLINKGIVTQDSNSLQFLLTDFGISYCKSNENDLGNDIFKF